MGLFRDSLIPRFRDSLVDLAYEFAVAVPTLLAGINYRICATMTGTRVAGWGKKKVQHDWNIEGSGH